MNNLTFRIFCLKYHIFHMSILRLMRHIMYMLQNENFNRENKKLNRNAHVFKRRLL